MPLETTPLTLVSTEDQLMKMCRQLKTQTQIAVDTEVSCVEDDDGNDDYNYTPPTGVCFTCLLHVLQLRLLPPPPSSLAPIKSRMETFWYRLTQVHLENSC